MTRLSVYLCILIQDGLLINEANREKLELFLDSEGPPKILVYYQSPDSGADNDQIALDPRILVTYGDTEKIK